MTNFSVLHISDLHRIKKENFDCLLSSLALEKREYERRGWPLPYVIVVSGDIVNGSNDDDSMRAQEEIKRQYEVASEFLVKLCHLFLDDDRMRMVMVPGNHDMSRYASKLSVKPVDPNDTAEMVNLLWEDENDIRWSWGDLKFYQIVDKDRYNRRFDDFINFYDNFYQQKLYFPQKPDEQSFIRDFPEINTSFICFNSCYCLDHLRLYGYIPPKSLSKRTNELIDLGAKGRLLVGVWHHHTHGLPKENNYLDYTILENMSKAGITMVLHGHQHICGIVNEYRDIFSKGNIWMVSAGTLYGNAHDLPTGKHRQYNFLTFNMHEDMCEVTLHSREDKTSLNTMPAWEAGIIGNSNLSEYTMQVSKQRATKIETPSSNLLFEINQINREVEKGGDVSIAVGKLLSMDLTNSIVRKFLLDYLLRLDDFSTIVNIFSNPRTPDEAIHALEAAMSIGEQEALKKLLACDYVRNSTDSNVRDMRELANKMI